MRATYHGNLARIAFAAVAFALAHAAATILCYSKWLSMPLGPLEISVRRFILRSAPAPFSDFYSHFDFEMGYVWILMNSFTCAIALSLLWLGLSNMFRPQQAKPEDAAPTSPHP